MRRLRAVLLRRSRLLRSRIRRLRRDRLSVALAALGVCAAVAIACGLLLGVTNFLSNLLAELAGFALSVIVAVKIVEKLTEERRRSRWELVRETTLREIRWNLGGWPYAAIRTRTFPLANYQETLRRFGGKPEGGLSAAAHLIHAAPPEGTSRALYSELQESFARLRAVWLPRVFDLADDPTLAELLLGAEKAERAWGTMLHFVEDVWDGVPADWDAAAALYAAAASVVAHIERTYDLRRIRFETARARP
jgi:hypothetical protein